MKTITSLNNLIAAAILILVQHRMTTAQTLYSLNFSNSSTYSITCGTITSNIWTVKNGDCNLTTSAIVLPASPATQTLSISTTIEGASLNYGDTATIRYCVNGVWTIQTIIHGQPGVNTETNTFNIIASANSTIYISINFFCDAGSDKWRMFNGGITIAPAPNPLPVELLTFAGEKAFNGLKLYWVTATESENNFFTLERSPDGNSYCMAGKVMGSGNSSTKKNYSFTDYEASAGINYYRLKQTDWNGSEIYCSKIIALEYEQASLSFDAYVYPNPLHDQNLHLYIGSSGEDILVLITDATGKNLFSKKFPLSSSEQIIELSDISGKLSPGLYFVIGISGDETYRQKLLVR